MTALTRESQPVEFIIGTSRYSRRFPVADGTLIYQGAMVAVTTSGKAVNATDTAALTVVGIAVQTAQSGDSIDAVCGFFELANDTTTPVGMTEINRKVYAKDNATVAKTTANSIPAGILRFFDERSGRPVLEIGSMQLN